VTSAPPFGDAANAPSGLAGLLPELEWRGMLHEATPGLAARLASGRPIAGYNGFDPSGSSLHVGHLVPVFGLLHLQRHGGRPVVVVGGATGMIGDPSGTSAERNLLDADTIAANAAGIRTQLERFLDWSPGPTSAVMVNNLDWLGPITMLDFLRDVGKHFTIPYMLAKDSVQGRMGGGLSYTEFSYMLLQATDYLHLHRELGVELQMGGADQWGNITAGLELIRRADGGAGERPDELAHALAYPLLLDASGAKFGKTSAGTSVWLDPERTTPYAFYQYWIERPDAEMPRLLRSFTLLSRDEIEALDSEQAARPEERRAQRVLAHDVTARVHGEDAARRALAVSEALFQRAPVTDPRLLATIHDGTRGPVVGNHAAAEGLAALLAATGLAASRSEARRLIVGGGVTVNGERVSDPAAVPQPIAGEWFEIRVGKRTRAVVRVERA
jgi:tyrosyl-tRNA synthetase